MGKSREALSRGFNRSAVVAGIMVFSLVSTVFLRLEAVAAKETFTHDEGISYLSATCHQISYSRAQSYARLVPALEWKKFLQVERPFCFRRIQLDLAQSDIHPPLYFWLLHLWVLHFGVSMWSGPLLNTVIAAVTIWFLFKFASEVLKSVWQASLVAFTYALNPAVILISTEARQYDLLTLLTLLLVWQTTVYTDRTRQPTRRNLYLLAVLTLAGALTHYYFILPLTACIAFSVARLVGRDWQRLKAALTAIGLGYVASFALHPFLATAVRRRAGGTDTFSFTGLVTRLEQVALSFTAFAYVLVALVAVFLALLFLYWKRRPDLRQYWRQIDLSGLYLLGFCCWIGGSLIILHLASVGPAHAMSAKYLSMIWPFFVFIPAFILRLLRSRPTAVLYFYLIPLLLGVFLALQLRGLKPTVAPSAYFDESDLIVVDNTERGVLPRIVWLIPDEKLVVAAMQDDLLARRESWIDSLGDGSIYVSDLTYGSSNGNTSAKRRQLLSLMSLSGYEAVPFEEGLLSIGTVFRVRRIN